MTDLQLQALSSAHFVCIIGMEGVSYRYKPYFKLFGFNAMHDVRLPLLASGLPQSLLPKSKETSSVFEMECV